MVGRIVTLVLFAASLGSVGAAVYFWHVGWLLSAVGLAAILGFMVYWDWRNGWKKRADGT